MVIPLTAPADLRVMARELATLNTKLDGVAGDVRAQRDQLEAIRHEVSLLAGTVVGALSVLAVVVVALGWLLW